jgi:DNA-binding NarL/FixJ family response regulator
MGSGRTSNIFTRLGVSSRAAATAYADEFHLL